MPLQIDKEIERTTICIIEAHAIWSARFAKDTDEERRRATWRSTLRLALAKAESRPPKGDGAASQQEVQDAEIEEMEFRRKVSGENDRFNTRLARLVSCANDPANVDAATVGAAIAREVQAGGPLISDNPFIQRDRLTGLAFSGGGIRSATFNLGVLQALANLKLLRQFDYLSAASGGGYIATWFAAWVKRAGWAAATENLQQEEHGDPNSKERAPIQFLREFSNYLTPELGLLSGDTWATVSIWLRNTMLNFAILVGFLSFLLLVPRAGLWIQIHWGHWLNSGWRYLLLYILSGLALIAVLANLMGFSCRPIAEVFTDRKRIPWYTNQKFVFLLVLLPLFAIAIFSVGHVWAIRFAIERKVLPGQDIDLRVLHGITGLLTGVFIFGIGFYLPMLSTPVRRIGWLLASIGFAYVLTGYINPLLLGVPLWVCISCAVTVLMWGMGWLGGFPDCFVQDKKKLIWYPIGIVLLMIFSAATGIVAGQFLRGIAAVLRRWAQEPSNITVFGVPMMIANFSIVVYLFIGLMGRYFPDARREWISRLAGWALLLSLGWMGLFACALYASAWMNKLTFELGKIPTKTMLTGIWAVITWFSVQAAKGQSTGKSARSDGGKAFPIAEYLALAGPYVFIVGLVTVLSIGLDAALRFATARQLANENHLIWLALGACLVVMSLSFTVDVNEFSMHHFYRNRLVRCYLGASNPNRSPNGFTGFDARDDIALAKFAPTQTTSGVTPYLGPYPILNAALNLTSGERLAYQERKAASFIFSPRYCGMDSAALDTRFALERDPGFAYRPTISYAYPEPGLHIGSAMAISGAAMNPNRGYHSSPATAFLLTVFNVRLGWWLGNPRSEKHCHKSSPRMGLAYLLKELFGHANDSAGYVYLSDGGHFENLGIYELVKRQCRFIVACDAEEDYRFGFEGLGNAIRKCRADLGIEIDIDVEQLRLQEDTGLSKWHCVVGKINYKQVKDEFETGTLIYLKSSVTGDEPSDLLEYSLRKKEFPHQTTLDQFFDESQFESYRRLGYHVATKAFETAIQDALPGKDASPPPERSVSFMEDLAYTLGQRWYPPSSAIEKSFTRHTESLNNLNERFRSDPDLRFLDRQFYPEWQELQKFATNQGIREILEKGCDKITARESYDPLWIPSRREEIRAGFFFSNLLIQLMENVYLDLNLERYGEHPDNQGWMNLFRHWAESGMFRVAYSISASTYGSRFRKFCARELDLSVGTLTLAPMREEDITSRERDLLKRIQAAGVYPRTPCQALQLQVMPGNADSRAPVFRYTVAMVLIENRQIGYFRVRRHVRGIGMGRTGLQFLIDHGQVDRNSPIGVPALPARKTRVDQFKRLIDSVR